MKTYNNHTLCKVAEFYYYDYLNTQSHELIPKDIIQHIDQCAFCQEKIDQLDTRLSSYSSDQSRKGLDTSIITDLLTLHLAYIDNKVDCQIVKPFLPVFLDPDFRIKIPTPISVHLDHCPQCAKDLETIENLNLTLIQSCRLSRLLADKKSKNKTFCSHARPAVPAIASLNFQTINPKILKHVCACPDCRETLYQLRQNVLTEQSHDKKKQKCSKCNQLSPSDIFDYVMMYGLDPDNEQNFVSEKSLASHLRDCPTGLAKIQKLHRGIYTIAEHNNSKIITIYHIDEFSKTPQVSESEDQYDGYPIRVEVTHQKDKENIEQKAPALTFASFKRKISVLHANPALKIGIGAVAVFLISITLLLRPSVAGALTMRQLYSAINQAKNVHISTFSGQSTPLQEKWISRSLNVSIFKSEQEQHLINFTTKDRKMKKAGTQSVQVIKLSDEVLSDFQSQTKGTLGLVPYERIAEIPANTVWNRVTDEESEALVENTEIYELMWTQSNYGGLPSFNKWLFTIDSETNLPEKIECYRKLNADSPYKLTSTIKIDYPDDNDMKAVIDSF